jgi:hypothetical protein
LTKQVDYILALKGDHGRIETRRANFALIRHMAQSFLRRPTNKLSLRARWKAAAWDNDFLISTLKPRWLLPIP